MNQKLIELLISKVFWIIITILVFITIITVVALRTTVVEETNETNIISTEQHESPFSVRENTRRIWGDLFLD